MAKCDLSIELVDGDRLFRGGERVQGTVVVQPDGDFNCKGLEISTRWETHGRGNIASGDIERVVAFQGEWLAGQTYRYNFDLAVGTWPPTYHGDSLSVDHVVRATAKLPWKVDPTVAHPFRVYVTDAPDSAAPPVVPQATGPVAKLLQGVIAVVVVAVLLLFLLNPFFWLLGAIVGIGSGVWWFFRTLLPRRKLGQVHFRVESERLAPGDTLRGELVLEPKKPIRLNGIEAKVIAKEVCVSGSGTNRSTHTAVVHEERVELVGAGELAGGQEHRFPIEITLPMRPIYSIDLSDNDVTWTAEARIDIPRWPDWKSQKTFRVVPPSDAAAAIALLPGVTEEDLRGAPAAAPVIEAVAVEAPRATAMPTDDARSEAGISFDETAGLLWANRENPEMVDRLVDAVRGMPMSVPVEIDRRSLYSESSDPSFADSDGTTFLGTYTNPPLPIILYLPTRSPSHIADIERQGRWSGEAQVVGFDAAQRRLMVRAV